MRDNRYRQYSCFCQPQLSIASVSDLRRSLVVRTWKRQQRFREMDLLNSSVDYAIRLKRINHLKKTNIRWPSDLKTPACSKMIVLVLFWNKLENSKNMSQKISSAAEQTAFRIQHRSSTVTLKYFGRCLKNKPSSLYDCLQLMYMSLSKLSSRIILSPVISYMLMKNSLSKGLVCKNNFKETQSLSKIMCKFWSSSSKSYFEINFLLEWGINLVQLNISSNISKWKYTCKLQLSN
jgi:hypothetical protein